MRRKMYREYSYRYMTVFSALTPRENQTDRKGKLESAIRQLTRLNNHGTILLLLTQERRQR